MKGQEANRLLHEFRDIGYDYSSDQDVVHICLQKISNYYTNLNPGGSVPAKKMVRLINKEYGTISNDRTVVYLCKKHGSLRILRLIPNRIQEQYGLVSSGSRWPGFMLFTYGLSYNKKVLVSTCKLTPLLYSGHAMKRLIERHNCFDFKSTLWLMFKSIPFYIFSFKAFRDNNPSDVKTQLLIPFENGLLLGHTAKSIANSIDAAVNIEEFSSNIHAYNKTDEYKDDLFYQVKSETLFLRTFISGNLLHKHQRRIFNRMNYLATENMSLILRFSESMMFKPGHFSRYLSSLELMKLNSLIDDFVQIVMSNDYETACNNR
ncbi:MAG: hypothetical protein HQM14_21540 [SAR324 cluster bacterium]|nr:hypothetical protein [SAR324 cluster bacterium]